MTASFERLQRIANIQSDLNAAYRNKETQVANPYQAVELELLTKDIQAAFGPTLKYMQGMDEYA